MEHGGRGFRAGQTALSATVGVPMCSWDNTLLLRVMVLMANVRFTWAFELWETWLGQESRFRLHSPSSCGLFSHPYVHGLWRFLLSFSSLVCGLGTGISHGYAHFVLSLERLCGTRVATHCDDCNDYISSDSSETKRFRVLQATLLTVHQMYIPFRN